jgi:hypothetical protein
MPVPPAKKGVFTTNLGLPGGAAVTAVHPAPAMISVAVPEGAVAGTVIQVQAPSGRGAIQVAVPEGAKPGQVIQVSVAPAAGAMER